MFTIEGRVSMQNPKLTNYCIKPKDRISEPEILEDLNTFLKSKLP